MTIRHSSLLLSLLIWIPTHTYACPKFNKVPDFNCDNKTVITVLGDSLAYGFGDTKNKNRGGYVLRTAKKLPLVTVYNEGVQGLRTFELLNDLKDAFDEGTNDSLKNRLKASDYVILDLGRNDRWIDYTPERTYRNLKRAASKIRSEVKALTGVAPLVITAVLMLPNRSAQGPFVKSLNARIFKASKTAAPSDLRFDLVSKRLLSSDQVHPTPIGYTALAKTLVSYLQKSIPLKVATLLPDADTDGIPDAYEALKFGTSPDLADTDGDTKSDGDEVFVTLTDPLVVD